jgi:hypothetical protein
MNNLLSFLRSETLPKQTRDELADLQIVYVIQQRMFVLWLTHLNNSHDWHYCGKKCDKKTLKYYFWNHQKRGVFCVSITHANVYSYWITSYFLLESKYKGDKKNIFWTSNTVSETTEALYCYKVFKSITNLKDITNNPDVLTFFVNEKYFACSIYRPSREHL